MDMKQKGQMDQVRGKIRSTWGDVTDDDIDRSEGNVEMLVGKIKERTGEAGDSIKKKLDQMFGHEDTGKRDGA
jgi:uncharacterized protein YjbJ (UPF0337 family)